MSRRIRENHTTDTNSCSNLKCPKFLNYLLNKGLKTGDFTGVKIKNSNVRNFKQFVITARHTLLIISRVKFSVFNARTTNKNLLILPHTVYLPILSDCLSTW